MPFNHFDFISPIYDRWGHFDPGHPLLKMLDLPGSGLILDIGGGTGRVAKALCAEDRKVIVVDISPGMLSRVRGKEGILPVMADAAALPFRQGAVDRTLIVDALHHIRDQKGTVRELHRTLKKGGRAVVVEPDVNIFAVKLIMLMEFVLWMGSHFLNRTELHDIFQDYPGKSSYLLWQGNVLVAHSKE